MNTLRSILLILAVCVATSAAQNSTPFGTTQQDLNGVQANAQQNRCILYLRETENEDGTDVSDWECQVFGPDAQSAGATTFTTMVDIDGISLVLAAKPDIRSGVTTLHAETAILANHKLTITTNEIISFGTIPTANTRRKLSAKSGNLEVLVVRVTTNDASLTKNSAGISDDIFGTNGDIVNFKSNAEDCSNNAVTVTPGTGSGSSCSDKPNFTSAGITQSGTDGNCGWFTIFQVIEPGVWCPVYGDKPDTGEGPETANTACCACGGGDIVNYNNPVQDGVLDINLNVNAKGLQRFDLEDLVQQELNTLFSVSDIGSRFDNIMICVPKGTFRSSDNSVKWIAYAYIGGSISVYNGDDDCANPTTHMHELGHNWGLMHASDLNDSELVEYGDLSGIMGYSTGDWDDESNGRYCFNGAHSWQLGWYSTDSLEIDPLTQTYVGGLAGVAKLPNGIAADEKIVLKLSNPTKDYYLIYNHAIGANIGTAEGKNQVTLTSKTTDPQGRTFLETLLSANTHYTFNDYDGNGSKVTIVVTTIDESATGRADIEVFPGELSERPVSNPDLTAGPTKSPVAEPTTAEPISMPESAPTGRPTSDPTSGPTSEPTSEPTSGPTKSPVAEPTTAEPTPMPTSAPTSVSTSAATQGPTKQSEINGDPHFKTWKNEHFEYHGQCDIVMVSNPNFADGLGIDIHIRTKMVRFWSYIQRAVIRIGNDILEVEGSLDMGKVKYWINYEYLGELTDLGGFPVSINGNTDKYTIDLGSLYPGEAIQMKTFKEFVGVKIIGASDLSFGNSTGITGDFATGNTYARDGKTVLNDFNELGNEWQVMPSDDILFYDVSRPQFPEICWIPEDPRGERRRRLDEISISEEQAEGACSQLEDEFSRKGCVYDILATQDLDMVGAY